MPSAQLRALALSAGFDLCGFARAEHLPPETLLPWLAAGMAADMAWMAETAADRLDPTRVQPGARTVVALACNHYHPDGAASSPIARYARGRDYHATLKDRLRAFRRGLAGAFPGVKLYAETDTGPMMEKVWAARAGLGYVGRNGCLITERFGSHVLLAAALLDREVDGYAPEAAPDRCGSCSLCVSACPTAAILDGARVDSRACLSYQTIENRGEVPEELRPAFGGLAFGCDLCQEECPLNSAPLLAGNRFLPRPIAALGVAELAALGPGEHRALTAGTAVARAKYDGLRRNAVYALGAARDESARPLLERLCSDESELVRSAARWAIGRLSG
ncbi:MAG: tRNA epoxyqueuosine(34) reductase QueG [Myxococcaceae bacterium]